MAGPDADEPQPSLSMIDSGIVEQMTKYVKKCKAFRSACFKINLPFFILIKFLPWLNKLLTWVIFSGQQS